MTLGKRGVLALVGGEPSLIAGRAVKAVDTTGAGDCFVGALAAQLAGGKPIRDALDYANAAASICVQRMGAAPSMPTAAEVDGFCVHSAPDFVGWAKARLRRAHHHTAPQRMVGTLRFAHPTKYQPSALFRSKLASAACSGVIEPWAASRRRPNMWSPARLTDSMPTSCPAL